MKTLRWIFTSNALLAIVAIQVFIQVWMLAVDAPFTGLIISMWLSWKLGTLAGYADVVQERINHERLVAKQLTDLQAGYESMPAEMRVDFGPQYIRAMERLTHLHQRLVEQSQLPMFKLKMRDLLPSPSRWLARRRQRKIMATAKVLQH